MGQTIHFQDVVSSTQKIAHELANNGAPEGTIIVADKLTEGRGRMARAWHSPEGNGIWMSIILRPEMPVQKNAAADAFSRSRDRSGSRRANRHRS
jgi:BirA family biotin operon repressor/biotin-[acetyl-CoA-carboxylase] ligase